MRRKLARVARSRRGLAAAVAVVLVASFTAVLLGRGDVVRTRQQFVPATPEPGGTAVTLDTTLYLPSRTPAPAILLAHGFGGDKRDLDSTARHLADAGYVVLGYTARGFGRSGGLIHLDSLDYEVPDARQLVSWLSARPEVMKTNGKSRIGVAGASYGGALALMLAGTDPRIEAVAADVTWNDLATALFPNGATGSAGVWKKAWAGSLFAGGVPRGSDPACGRFAPDVCRAYQEASTTGLASADLLALLHRSSPAAVTSAITAPVLLSQGENDSLFPLSEADANARQIAAHGTPVRVIWRSGGHDAGGSVGDDVLAGWFNDAFAGRVHGDQPFQLAQTGSAVSTSTGRVEELTLRLKSYPPTNSPVTLPVSGVPFPIAAPAGGEPAIITSGPGLGALGAGAGLAAALTGAPGQTAVFCTKPLAQSVLVGGGSAVDLTVASATDATLFVSVHDFSTGGGDLLPAGLVTPVHLDGPGKARVALPWVVHSFAAGHQICLNVSTTDAGYLLPSSPRTYAISVTGGLVLNTIHAPHVSAGYPLAWLLAGLLALVVAGAAFLVSRPRRARAMPTRTTDLPLSVAGLVKEYGDGYRAVDGISFEVRAGQIVGLLGPNGAGKTTALRAIVGLVTPTQGEIRVFGQPIRPGAAVLGRVGAFIEGPGFLPHLSGRENLRLYWAATGRPADEAQFDVALDIAGLDGSVERRVKSYSHGMKQRLGIAQAMLGLPDVLVLDEPTNGLDPPQIAEMREVMRAYARTGRTVLVSSHLLGEVEQTCTHVVVMNRGRVVASGAVGDVAGNGGFALAVTDAAAAAAVLAAAGIESELVPVRRSLEDVFLHLVGEDES